MERTRQDLVLGLVFFGSLAILMWATIELTGLSFLGEPEQRTVLFRNASGLREGDNVFVLGHRLGSVESIRYNPSAAAPDQRIEVVLRLDQAIQVTDAYEVAIEPGSLLGGVQIQFDPGDGPGSVPADQPLRGQVRIAGLDAVGELFADDAIGDDLRAILAGIRTAVERLNAGEGTMGRLLVDPSLFDLAVAAVDSARLSLEQIGRGEGAIGRLIHGEALAEDLSAIAGNLRSVSAKLDGAEGLLGRLLGDPDLGAQGAQIVDDVAAVTADLRAGRGTVGALLSDAGMADDVRRLTSGFADLAEAVNDPQKGLIGELVAGAGTRERFTTFVADLSDISTSIREARGLAGRLIYDEELGEQFSRMLSQVSRAIEDAREAAPVGTFFQVVSGAF
jgi:phospholipid/cholesterol/gamma-HCH transport system substrate-binding protein